MRSTLPPKLPPLGLWRVCVWLTVLLAVLAVTGVLVSRTVAILVTLGLGLVVGVVFLWGTRSWSRAVVPAPGKGCPADRAERRWWYGWFWLMLTVGPAFSIVLTSLDRAGSKGELSPWLEKLRRMELDWVIMGVLGLSAIASAGCLVRAQVRDQSKIHFVLLVLFCSVALCFAQALTLFLVTWLFRVKL